MVVLCHKSHFFADRNWLYTAVTRASKYCILVGDRWGFVVRLRRTASVSVERFWIVGESASWIAGGEILSSAPQPPFQAIDQNCPNCIRDRNQWVAWKYVERGGKPTKAPINPRDGSLASSTDPSSWGTFSEAIDACRRNSALAGVGFVFTADDPYCGVDLDDSLDESTGELKPWAQQIVDRLDSYTEISPSVSGLKVFIKANKPGSRCRKAYEDGEVEIYDRDRFFTVTGDRLATISSEINIRQESLDLIYAQVSEMRIQALMQFQLPIAVRSQAIVDRLL